MIGERQAKSGGGSSCITPYCSWRKPATSRRLRLLALPRWVDVSKIVSAPLSKTNFIRQAYETILQRSPSAEEIAAQLNAWRWPATRSDFLFAMSQCPEAGDLTLAGLSVCVTQVFRLVKANRNSASTSASSGDDEVTRISASLTHLSASLTHLSDQVKAGEQLAQLRSEQSSSLNRQVAALENTLSRLRVRMETEGAKTSELASDGKVMLELIRGLATRIDSIAQTMKELPLEVNSIRGVIAQAVASASRVESAVTHLAKQILPPVIPGGDTVVTKVDGFLIGVPVSEWRLSTYYHHYGPLEPGVYKLLQTLIRPGMTVVDVGANVGLYTLLAARTLNGVGLVFGFEPHPRTFGVLRDNVQLNGFLESGVVRLHNMATQQRLGRRHCSAVPRIRHTPHYSRRRDRHLSQRFLPHRLTSYLVTKRMLT